MKEKTKSKLLTILFIVVSAVVILSSSASAIQTAKDLLGKEDTKVEQSDDVNTDAAACEIGVI